MSEKTEKHTKLSKFTIPTPRVPTREERKAFAQKQIDRYRRFMLDLTYPKMSDISIPATFIPLTTEQACAFEEMVLQEREHPFDKENIAKSEMVTTICCQIDNAIQHFGVPCFVRLNSRSPKDAWNERYETGRQAPAHNGVEALRAFYMSERIFTDLLDANPVESPVSIVVRPYLDNIKNENEFRVFVEDGKIVGLCRMFVRDEPEQWHEERFSHIDAALRTLAENAIARLPELPSFSLDAVIFPEQNATELKATAIEINPPLSAGTTDPLYFAMNPPDGRLHIESTARRAGTESPLA